MISKAMLLALILFSACAVPDPCAGVRSGGDRAPTPVEERELLALRSVAGAPAAQLAVQFRDAPRWVGAIGCASLETGQPATPEDRFFAGSVTKTFTAALVL